MQITMEIDAENDLVYLAFWPRPLKHGAVKKSVRAGYDVTLDFDARGTLLGLDVANASKVLGSRPGTA